MDRKWASAMVSSSTPQVPSAGRCPGWRYRTWKFEYATEDRPFSNVFAKMLQQLQVPTEEFPDSDGLVKELLTEGA
jgi:hypothetical protein